MTPRIRRPSSAGTPKTSASGRALPTVPGLEVLEEVSRTVPRTIYQVRRGNADYLLTMLAPHPGAPRELARRASRLAGIDHPGLPRVHEIGEIQNRAYWVTDFVPGLRLADLIPENPFSEREICSLAKDIAGPLTAMHRQGLVHGDLTAANITVLDDGSARLSGPGLTGLPADGTGGMGAAVGPGGVDSRSDLQSLELILSQCLGGPLPEALRTVLAPIPEQYGAGRWAGPRLCGRDREFGQLSELWDQARRGTPRRCALHGAAGSGTSRLAAQLAQHARQTGYPVLWLDCGSDSPVPFSALRRALADVCRDAATAPDPSARHDLIRVAAGPGAGLLAGLGPELDTVLGVSPLTDGDRHEQFGAAVARFIGELARLSGGLILVYDDAHRLDPATRQVMNRLTGPAEIPLLTITTGQPNKPRPNKPRRLDLDQLDEPDRPDHLDLVLEPLTDAGMQALLHTQVPGLDPNAPLARQLLADSQGNPFIILTRLHSIIDTGRLRPVWGDWLVEDGDGEYPRYPADRRGIVQGLVAGQVSRLQQRTRALLVVAAVIGTRFRADVAAEVCAVPMDAARAAVAEAVAGQLIELSSADGNSVEYVFRSERLREALLTTLSGEERAQLHQKIAQALDRPGSDRPGSDLAVYEIARHYQLAGGLAATDARAAEVGPAAGRQALLAHAPGPAVGFFEQALVLRPGDAQLLHALGIALHRDGRDTQAHRPLEKALELEPAALGRARVLLTLTAVHRASGNVPAAVRTVTRGLRELRGTHDQDQEKQHLLVELHQAGGRLAASRLRAGEEVGYGLRQALAATRLGPGASYRRSRAATALTAARLGRPRLARLQFERAGRSTAGPGDPQLTAWIAWCAGAADYADGTDDGQRWARCLTEQGDWLDEEDRAAAVAVLCWEAAVQGHTANVLRWSSSGSLVPGSPAQGPPGLVSLTLVGPLRLAALGQAAEANAELGRVRAALGPSGSPLFLVDLAMTELYVLNEQGEPFERDDVDQQFEVTAARFFSFGLSPSRMLRQHRSFLLLHAWGRLAQCRAAPTATALDQRLTLARTALTRLRKVTNTPLLRGGYQQCQAELLVQQRQPDRALAVLHRLEVPQAPRLRFEIHRTTARALFAEKSSSAGRRQIQAALALAELHHWPHQRHALELEFGPSGPDGG